MSRLEQTPAQRVGPGIRVGEAEHHEDAARRLRHHRPQHGADQANGLQQAVQERVDLGAALRILHRLPGRLCHDPLVELPDPAPDEGEGARVVERFVAGEHGFHEGRPAVLVVHLAGLEARLQALVAGVEGDRACGDLAVAEAGRHRHRPRHEVAEVVGEVAVVALHHRAVREVPVLAERALAQEEVAEGVHAVLRDELVGIDRVARRLAELAPVAGEPAVREDARGHGKAGGVQHGRPDDAVEADDLLAHEVHPLVRLLPELHVLGGVIREAEGGDVVGQRVHPHVEDVGGLLRHGDPPLHARAADADVLQALLDHGQHLVAPARGLDEQDLGADLLLQPRRVRGQPEEVVLLLRELAGPLVDRAEVAGLLQLVFVLEFLAARAVPAGVGRAVHGRTLRGLRLFELAPQRKDAALVDLVGGADEPVVGDVELVPELLEPRRDHVAVGLGVHALLAGRALDVLAVLVGSGEEEDVPPAQPPRPGQRVRGHRRVGVARVRDVVHVVDRRGVDGGLAHFRFTAW